MTTRIFVGDCRDVLQGIPDNWYHTVVTSPPYWALRDYGTDPLVWGGDAGCGHEWGDEGCRRNGRDWDPTKGDSPVQRDYTGSTGQFCHLCGAWRGNLGLEPTPELFVEHMVEVFKEVRRVLRPDGTVWLNLGDSYATGSKGTADGMIPQDWIENGQLKKAGMTRAGCPPGLKPKDLVGIPWRVAFALQADGWWLRSDIIWHKPNCMPESVTDRPTKAHEYVFLLTKSKIYYYDADAVREPMIKGDANSGAKNYRPDNGGWRDDSTQGRIDNPAGRNRRTVWTIPTSPFKGAHFATFPPALVTPCIKAGSSERGCCPECGSPWRRVVEKRFIHQQDCTNEAATIRGKDGQKPMDASNGWQGFPRGTTQSTTTGWTPTCKCDAGDPIPCRTLDPFGGAGTVALVSRQLGRDCDIIELSAEYATMAQQRLDQTPVLTVETGAGDVEVQQIPMFSEVTVR